MSVRAPLTPEEVILLAIDNAVAGDDVAEEILDALKSEGYRIVLEPNFVEMLTTLKGTIDDAIEALNA